jgi:hypothetical protein
VAPSQQVFAAQLEAVLLAAVRWGILRLRAGERAEFSNWRFEHNQVAGDPGVLVISRPGGNEPLAFSHCTFRFNDYLSLADLLIRLVNEELARRAL